MGGKLSTSSRFSSRRPNPRADNEYAEPPSSEIVGPTSCFGVKKPRKKKNNNNKKDRDEVGPKLEPSEKKVKLTRHHLTLEEWILLSPGTDRAGNTVKGGELFVFTQVYKGKSPSPSFCSTIVTAEDGFTSRRTAHEDGEGRGEEDSLSICRSESRRSRKKVSFRLPEETNSIVFYTPSPAERDPNTEIATSMMSRIMISNSL